MTETPITQGTLTDDDVLNYTQQVRRQLVGEMTANGMPTDKGDRMVMLTALADMDRTAQGNKKIGAKEKNTAAALQAAEIFSRLMDKLGDNSPFEARSIIEHAPVPQLSAPPLDSSEMAPGETAIGVSDENYDAFIKRMEG